MKKVKERVKNRYAIWDDDKKIKDNLSAGEVAGHFDTTNMGLASAYSSRGLLYKKRYRITKVGEKPTAKSEGNFKFKKEWDKARFSINPNAKGRQK